MIEICGNSRARWEDGLAAVEDISHADAVHAIPARPHRNPLTGKLFAFDGVPERREHGVEVYRGQSLGSAK